MKTKKYRKITHRKHYRKKNIIKSKKVHKSTRRNNKKRYKGGSIDMSPYTFDSFQYMLGSLQNLIKPSNDTVKLYEGSILDVILENIKTNGTIDEKLFNGFPELIKLILKLEVKPSNTLEFIYFIFKVKEEDKEDFKELLGFHDDLIKFIDKNRSETETEDYEIGWSLLSSFVITLIEAIDMSVDFGLGEKINEVYNKDSIIQCGLIDSFLYDSKHTQSDLDRSYKTSIKVTNFYNSFRFPPTQSIKRPDTIRRDTIRRDTVERPPRKTIYDFFDKEKNPTGILPPFVLFILLFRINPDINSDTNEKMMKNRITILNNIQYYLTICCKQCCVGGKCTESKCVKGDPKLVSLFKGIALEENICIKSSCLNKFNWKTFDNIFLKVTNNNTFVELLIETPLFYNIAPLSTFLPINANTYIKEVFYKDMNDKKKLEFDAKIEFYENEIYKAYKQSEDGLCSIEENRDLCDDYLRDGPLYIPYNLLLMIIEKYKIYKKNKNDPFALTKVIGNARKKRDTIRKKEEKEKERAASAIENKKSSGRFTSFFRKKQIEPLPIVEEDIYLDPVSSNRSSSSDSFKSAIDV